MNKTHVTFRLSKEAIAVIDACQEQYKFPSRTEALEKLIQIGKKPLLPNQCKYSGYCFYKGENGECNYTKHCHLKEVGKTILTKEQPQNASNQS